MKIAYVINSLEGGGAALPVPAIARVLRDNGADVRVFALTMRDGRALPPMQAAGLDVLVRDGGEKDHAAALRWLDRAVAEWKPSLLWTSLTRATLLGQLVGALRRLPVVSWQHNAFLKPANLMLLRAMSRLSEFWVADSDRVAALTARRLRVPSGRLATWPIFAADPDAPTAIPWRPGEVFRIGSLGRLHPAKGYDILIAALAQLKAGGFSPATDFEVIVGGEGEERARLEAQAAAADVRNIRFAGYIDDTRNFLATLHLYVQPSRREGFCIAAHEAMQADLPVIASAVGELPFSIEEGVSGHTLPPCDAERLVAALAEMLSTPERAAAMGSAARARVLDRFGPAAFAANGGAILQRVTAAI